MYHEILNSVRTLAMIREEQLPAILRTAPYEHRQLLANTIVDWRPDLVVSMKEALVMVGIEGPTDSIAYP